MVGRIALGSIYTISLLREHAPDPLDGSWNHVLYIIFSQVCNDYLAVSELSYSYSHQSSYQFTQNTWELYSPASLAT